MGNKRQGEGQLSKKAKDRQLRKAARQGTVTYGHNRLQLERHI